MDYDVIGKYARESFMRSFYKYKRISVRDIDGGDEPFLYTTSNKGPGYVDVKGGVGIDDFMDTAVLRLSSRLMYEGVHVDVVVGMMTGGAIPGYLLKQKLQEMWSHRVVYIYQRSEAKTTGHGELDTGCQNNPYIFPGQEYIVVEELINFGKTTVKGVTYERSKGNKCDVAACILSYENPDAKQRLADNGIKVVAAATLPEVLEYGYANDFLSDSAYKGYMKFLESPAEWHSKYGFEYFG